MNFFTRRPPAANDAIFTAKSHEKIWRKNKLSFIICWVIVPHLLFLLLTTAEFIIWFKEANRGRVTPSTEFTCYHVAYLIGLSHLCALLVYQCLIVPTNENVQMKQASAATFQNLELARNCYRSLHLQFVFNLILLKVIVILQYLLVINLI